MTEKGTIKLKVPHQDLEHSSFFDTGRDSIAEWIGDLPMANLGQATRQLYQALSELNRVKLLPGKRLAFLEELRPAIHLVSRSLGKHYLNQPVVLPEQASKVAELAHALHQQLAAGYTIVATHTAALGKRAGIAKPAPLIAKALHRAMTDHTLNILRSFQLYQPIEPGQWGRLHQFYTLASQQHLLDEQIDDEEFGNSSLINCYIRSLLLGCCKPNQLRQDDLTSVFPALTQWSKDCTLNPGPSESLFVVDTTGDHPPFYRELAEADIQDHWLSLNTSQLTAELSTLRNNAGGNPRLVIDDKTISTDLLNHLVLAWSLLSKRNFMRLEADEQIDICVGLNTTHHFISGEISLTTLVSKRGTKALSDHHENPFLKTQTSATRSKDVWDSAYDSDANHANISLESIDYHIQKNEQQPGGSGKYNSHQAHMVNSSANGYCLTWPGGTPVELRAGEIVGLKESHHNNWNIAVIRWLSLPEDGDVQLGLQLISPSAYPYGIKLLNKTGKPSEYMRALLLPETPAADQPVTLITPRLPFREGQKVLLTQQGKEKQMQLKRKINSTGAYNQFELKKVSSIGDNPPPEPGNDDGFDSVWRTL